MPPRIDALRASRRAPHPVVRAARPLIALLLLCAQAPAAPARPLYYDRPITEADVAGRGLRELAILRNTIFARHGQPFRKQWLDHYFSKQAWYKPGAVVDPRTLSPVDGQNADFLSRYEIALPRAELERRLQPIVDRHRNQVGGQGRPLALALSGDGKTALFGSRGGVESFDVGSGRRVSAWSADGLIAVTVSADKTAAVVLGEPARVQTLDLSRPDAARVVSRSRLDGNWQRRVAVSPDGRRLLGGQAYDDDEHAPSVVEPRVVLADAASGKVLHAEDAAEGDDVCFAFSGRGDRAVVATARELAVWDAASGKPIWRRPRPPGSPCFVAASADGKLVLADNVLRDGGSGAVLRELELGHFEERSDVVAFSPGGDRLLAAGDGHHGRPYLALFRVADGRRIRILDAATTISAVAWSPDGKRALTYGDGGLAVWDVGSGHRVPALPGHQPWNDTDEAIEAMLLSRALGRELPGVPGLDAERSPLDAPGLLDELVPVATLERMSRRDLRILRNMVYARRGRPFRSDILRKYFERLDWYKADPAYTDARLTATDRRNVKIIQSAEIKAGGPLTDREHAEADIPEA